LGADLDLGAEAAAYVGSDAAHLVLGQAESVGDGVADLKWTLRGGVDRESAIRCRDCEQCVSLQGNRSQALVGHPLPDYHFGPFQWVARLGIAGADLEGQNSRRLEGDLHRTRLIVDGDRERSVGGA